MIAAHIHDALTQVKRLQELIIEKKHFLGYSGKARVASGLSTLIGAIVLSSTRVPPTPEAHLVGWGIVLVLAVVFNYSSLAYWFLFDDHVRRNPLMLKPAVDAVPALLIGGALSVALIAAGHYNLLFGVWMCLYGLAQVAYRLSMPIGIYWVGLCYILCGILYLLIPGLAFTNPWPMGTMFFLGETAGGIILISNHAHHHAEKTEGVPDDKQDE